MKKIFLYIVMCVTTLGLMTSCGDNEDFSSIHVLTDDEIAEMERQQHIKDSLKNVIPAEFVYEYNVDLLVGKSYEGQKLEIDLDAIANDLGCTKEGIIYKAAEYWGYANADAAKVTFYGIEWPSRKDNMGAATSSSSWGHWWNENGEVTSWGEGSAVYTEFQCDWNENDEPIGAYFAVGQMPDVFTEPATVTVLEAIKHQDTRVALKITFNIQNPAAITGNVVAEKDMTISVGTSANDFVSATATFDTNEVIEALGISSMSEAKVIGVKPDGTYTDMPTANAGFWYNADGTVGKYGDAPFYVEYYGYSEDYPEDEKTFYVGTMPGVAEFLVEYPAKMGFIANGKIFMYNLTIAVNTMSVATEMRPNETNATITFDHEAVMTALGISSMSEATLVNVNADGTLTEGNYTANSGWWYNADGTIGSWPDAAYAVEYYWGTEEWPEDDYTLYIATMGTLESGDVKTAHLGFKVGEKILYLNVTLNIVEPIVVKGEIVNTYDAAVSFTASAEEYTGDGYEINVEEVCAALGIESLADAIVFGIDPNDPSGYSYAYTANNGFWFNADGTIGTYGEAVFFAEFDGEKTINLGQMPGKLAAGETYNCKLGLYSLNDKMVMFNFDITIK